MAEMNRQITLAARPKGMPKPTDFKLVEAPMPEIGGGEVLVKTLFMSVDPYMRGRMNEGRSYARGVDIGEVMMGGTVGEVIESTDHTLQPGDIVQSQMGWQAYGKAIGSEVRKIDPDLAPISTSLGVLGMPGLTAYFGLLEVGDPKPSDTVMVSAAAGSVGHMVGQIAKIKGCHVIGISGNDDKCNMLKDNLGFDAALNYKDANFRQNLKDSTPNGLDVYFDNTGGMILGSALFRMNPGGRIACCGVVSQYDTSSPEPGPRGIPGLLINNRIKMEGFLIFDFAEKYDHATDEILGWIGSGDLKILTDKVEGLEAAPEAFVDLLAGGNIGTRIVRLS